MHRFRIASRLVIYPIVLATSAGFCLSPASASETTGTSLFVSPDGDDLRVPHVGWNDLIRVADCAMFDGLPDDALFYYVHSFRLAPVKSEIVIGECDYGGRFAAAIRQDNIWAVQFHPEKSQQSGLRLLKNFLEHGAA